jgi:hypothetical protein
MACGNENGDRPYLFARCDATENRD